MLVEVLNHNQTHIKVIYHPLKNLTLNFFNIPNGIGQAVYPS
jgi:hypothetical protein